MNFRTELLKLIVNMRSINHYCTAPPLGSVFGSAVSSRKKKKMNVIKQNKNITLMKKLS